MKFICSLFFVLCGSISALGAEAELEEWLKSQETKGSVLGISVQWQRGDESGALSFGREPAALVGDGQEGAKGDSSDDHPVDPVMGDAVNGATRFEIGSISKVLTNLLLAETIAQGKVSDTTTIGELMGSEVQYAQPEVGKITLLELATHRSGLPRLPSNLMPSDPLDPYADFDAAALINAMKDVRALQPLNKKYAYSNLGVGLLGYLLGKVHGSDYRSAVAEHVLAPLGMSRSNFSDGLDLMPGFTGGEKHPVWHFEDALIGAGGLRSCTDDLMRLGRWAMATKETAAPLQLDTSRALTVIDRAAGSFKITPVWHVAFAGDAPIYFHNGATGGSRSFLGIRPDSGQIIALLVSGDADPTGIGLDWLGAVPKLADFPPIDESIIGHYRFSPTITLQIARAGKQLTCQLSGQPTVLIEPMEDDWYAMTVADASLQFLREGDRVTALDLVQFGMRQRAQRLAEPPKREAADEVNLTPEILDEYVGEYSLSPKLKITIRRSGEGADGLGIEAQLTGQPYFPVFARTKDVFFYKVVEAELHFDRDSRGAIQAIVLHQNGRKMRAGRLNRPED